MSMQSCPTCGDEPKVKEDGLNVYVYCSGCYTGAPNEMVGRASFPPHESPKSRTIAAVEDWNEQVEEVKPCDAT